METKTRVLIAEPGEDLRNLLASHIQEDEGMELAGATGDGEEALALVSQLRPDVLLTELMLAQAGRAEPAAPRGGGEPRHALRSSSPASGTRGSSRSAPSSACATSSPSPATRPRCSRTSGSSPPRAARRPGAWAWLSRTRSPASRRWSRTSSTRIGVPAPHQGLPVPARGHPHHDKRHGRHQRRHQGGSTPPWRASSPPPPPASSARYATPSRSPGTAATSRRCRSSSLHRLAT